jgi:hypothetical protein
MGNPSDTQSVARWWHKQLNICGTQLLCNCVQVHAQTRSNLRACLSTCRWSGRSRPPRWHRSSLHKYCFRFAVYSKTEECAAVRVRTILIDEGLCAFHHTIYLCCRLFVEPLHVYVTTGLVRHGEPNGTVNDTVVIVNVTSSYRTVNDAAVFEFLWCVVEGSQPFLGDVVNGDCLPVRLDNSRS